MVRFSAQMVYLRRDALIKSSVVWTRACFHGSAKKEAREIRYDRAQPVPNFTGLPKFLLLTIE